VDPGVVDKCFVRCKISFRDEHEGAGGDVVGLSIVCTG
jgi:hypothetical protein